MIPGDDWKVDRIVRVIDGDSLRLVRRRTGIAGDGLGLDIYDTNPDGAAVRLITVDTPERGEAGYQEAATDVRIWLNTHAKLGFRIETWPDGGFGRVLGDLYVTTDRGNTLSQHLLRNCGWLPYVKGQ